MLQTASNPEGLPPQVFDDLRSGIVTDRSQFYGDLAQMFSGANRPGAEVAQGTLDQFRLRRMQTGLLNACESIKAFYETDFTDDLKKVDVATLVMHGEDDQIVPLRDSAVKSVRLIDGAKTIRSLRLDWHERACRRHEPDRHELPSRARLGEVWVTMRENGLGEMPVVAPDFRPVGVLHATDALQVLLDEFAHEALLSRDYVMGIGSLSRHPTSHPASRRRCFAAHLPVTRQL